MEDKRRKQPSVFAPLPKARRMRGKSQKSNALAQLPIHEELQTTEIKPEQLQQTTIEEPSEFSNADGEGVKYNNMENDNKNTGETNTVSETSETTVEEVKPPLPSEKAINENARPTTQDSEWSPLSGEVIKREYAKGYGTETGNNEPVIESVPEPKFQAPPTPPPPKVDANGQTSNTMTGNDDSGGGNGGNNSDTTKKPDPIKPLNPEMAELSNKDKVRGASMMVDGILSAYKQAWGLVHENWVKVKDEDIISWVMQDKISLDISITIDALGNEMSVREFIQNYNSTSADAFIVTDEFVNSVRDSMIREFTKRGWGITDMQNIIQAFIRDSGTKAMALFTLKKTMNQILKQQFSMHQEIQEMKAKNFGDVYEKRMRQSVEEEVKARVEADKRREQRQTQQVETPPAQQTNRTARNTQRDYTQQTVTAPTVQEVKTPQQQPQQQHVEVVPTTEVYEEKQTDMSGLVESYSIERAIPPTQEGVDPNNEVQE